VEQDLANHSLLFVDDVVAESLTSYVAGLQRSLPSNVQFRVVAPFSRAAPWWVAEWLWPRRFTLRSILDRNASPAIVRATEVAIGTIDSSLDIPYSHAQANERSLISIALELDQAATRTVLLTDCSCCDGDGLLAVETLMSAVQDICSTVVVLVGTTESSRAHFSHWVRSRASTSWSICSEKDVNERLRVIIERR
jgi:hypothetical protein